METVAIIGSGLIGRSWGMLFASRGHRVHLYDSDPATLENAPRLIRELLLSLESKGQLRPSDLSVDQQLELITLHPDLKDALKDVTYIQENTPERYEIKKSVFEELDRILTELGNDRVIVGSSTSTMKGSLFIADGLQERSIVVHPVNPPYFVKLVELIPTPRTKTEVTTKLRSLMESIDMKPVVLNKEILGFALNRIQYSILNEVWRLVSDGVLSVADVDTVMREGLAPRYIFMGPLETAQLNANGFRDYCERYCDCIHEVSKDMGPIPLMTVAAGMEIDRQLQELVPDDKLAERRTWRDENLARLASFKLQLGL